MSRVTHILFVLAFTLTSAIAAPFAVCQHADAREHAAALASSDVSGAVAAQVEDSAEAAAEKRGSLAEAAAGVLTPVMLPKIYPAMPGRLAQVVDWFADPPAELAGRSVLPLLTPPLT